MAEQDITEYTLPESAYMTFDAESLKSMILQRMQDQGMFTDQIYEGSNLSSFIDIIAYSYHVLMFYLNRTSSESVFTQTTLYENMNRIVKLLNYSPLGYQTSALTFRTFATEELLPGSYTIPRYTFINSNGIVYSTDTDISFTKTTTSTEQIDVIGSSYLLYQGKWVENAAIKAIGNPFEVVLLNPGADTKISHFHVHVYVKEVTTGKYHQFTETQSMYLHGPEDLVFEKRLNENMAYELKFGNNINGKRLTAGDEIQIYYIQSAGEEGVVGPNFLDDTKLTLYGTTKFTQIKNDVRAQNIRYITFDNLEALYMSNNAGSTAPQDRESVDQIREKAPVHFASGDRLVTLTDYESFMSRNYNKILSSTHVVDNQTFLDGHFRYMLEDVGIDNPNLESRIMFNHLDVASSNTFNNIYVYSVPNVSQNTSVQPMTNFLGNAQKTIILNNMNQQKMVSHEIIMMDPVYVAVNIATRGAGEVEDPVLSDSTVLQVKRAPSVLRDDDAIKDELVNIFNNYFSSTNAELGQAISTADLSVEMLAVAGVEQISTVRTDTGQSTPGLSLVIWNPVYMSDTTITTQNVKLPYFKYPYVHDAFNLYNKIEIVA